MIATQAIHPTILEKAHEVQEQNNYIIGLKSQPLLQPNHMQKLLKTGAFNKNTPKSRHLGAQNSKLVPKETSRDVLIAEQYFSQPKIRIPDVIKAPAVMSKDSSVHISNITNLNKKAFQLFKKQQKTHRGNKKMERADLGLLDNIQTRQLVALRKMRGQSAQNSPMRIKVKAN